MAPGSYRYYCLDGSGRLHDVAWFDAENDEDAIKQIEDKHPGDQCEIWEARRLVAKLSPSRQAL
jgi:hypothetical protein